MDVGVLLRLLAVLALVAANAFFVAAEFGLVSARRTRIREMIDSGDRLARTVQRAQQDLDRAISGTQLGITLASLGLGWIGEPAVAHTIEPLLDAVGIDAPVALHSVAVTIAFLLITYLHIVLGELAPKTLALARPETVSRLVAGPLIAFNRVVSPGIWLLNGSSSLVLRLLHVGTRGDSYDNVHSPEEIEMLVRQSLEEGVVEEDEQAMIQGVFELTRTVAREVMTPRPDIVAVETRAPLREVLAVAAASGFSRLPVYRESLDEIVGVVVVKDLIEALMSGMEETTADAVMREPLFVPDTKPIDDLLAELRHRKTHMAVVVDEFGGTDGLVTLEDLVEEIVGEIYDEHDTATAEVSVDADGRTVIDGGHSFADLIERFDLPDPADGDGDEYDTVAGFVISALGRIPDPGDAVPLGSAELRVLEVTDRRVTKLELRGVEGVAPGHESGEGED